MIIPMGIPDIMFTEICKILPIIFLSDRDKCTEDLRIKIKNLWMVQKVMLTDLGRQSLFCVLKSIDLKNSDEIIIPSYVCQSVILPILKLKCRPVFVDCDESFNISLCNIKEKVTNNTKVIVAPHMYGHINKNIIEIERFASEKNIFLVDDAAQAVGGKISNRYVGSFGNVGILSFGPFKSIFSIRGGALLINDKNFQSQGNLKNNQNYIQLLIKLAKFLINFKMRKYTKNKFSDIKSYRRTELRSLLSQETLDFSEIFPLDISFVDSIITLNQLKRIESIINKRQILADNLIELLRNKEDIFILPPSKESNVYTKFVLTLKKPYKNKKQKILSYLKVNGIEAQGGYIPLHLQSKYSNYVSTSLPQIEDLWYGVICLPINSTMTMKHIYYIEKIINQFDW